MLPELLRSQDHCTSFRGCRHPIAALICISTSQYFFLPKPSTYDAYIVLISVFPPGTHGASAPDLPPHFVLQRANGLNIHGTTAIYAPLAIPIFLFPRRLYDVRANEFPVPRASLGYYVCRQVAPDNVSQMVSILTHDGLVYAVGLPRNAAGH